MLPQLDPSSYISQLFWLAVTFGTLYLVMARLTLPRIREVLQNRQSRIADDLEKASSMKAEAEAAKTDYMTGLEEARNKAKQLLDDASEAIKKETATRNSQLDETLAHQISEAEARVSKLKEDTEAQLKPVSEELARMIVDTLLNPTQSNNDLGDNVIQIARGKA